MKNKPLFSLILCFQLTLGGSFAQTSNIKVYSNQLLEKSYIGNGVQWSAYPTLDISEKSWQRVFERLNFMKLNFIRLMVSANEYCITYPVGGKPEYNFDASKIKRVCRILDYCQSHNVEVILGDWDNPARKNKTIDSSKRNLYWDGITETDTRWTEIIGEFINYLIHVKKYTCIKYYNLGNEPNGYWMSCSSFDTWKISILNLDKELKKRSLRDQIKIVGPDCAWGNEWIKKIIYDNELCNAIDLYEVHWYATDKEVENEEYGKEMAYYRDYITKNDPKGAQKKLFIAEAGMKTGKNDFDQQTNIATFQYGVWMTDFVIQSMNAGEAGLIAWDLDDAMYTSGKPGPGDGITDYNWKIWGFWDSFGEEKGKPELTNLRPWFYPWSLMAKYIPKGSQVIKSSRSGIPGLRVSVSRYNSNYTILVINNVPVKRTIHISFEGTHTKNIDFNQFNYFENDMPVDRKGFPISKRTIRVNKLSEGITLTLPSKGVIILTTMQ